jgi:hypothetical protein
MTITIDGQPEISLHPLDVTTESLSDPSSSTCVGLIQTIGSEVADVDIILGVAFLRNVYTVMAYDVPDASGQFPPNGDGKEELSPRLGLLGLTNATQALQEFHNVRVLNQPLTTGEGGNTPSSAAASTKSGKLSVGIDVLLALVGFIVACAALFGLRWFVVKRRLRRTGPRLGVAADAANDKRGGAFGAAYQLAHRASSSSSASGSGSDPAVRARTSLGGSPRTFVAQEDDVFVEEFGQLRPPKDQDGSVPRDSERQVSYLNLDPSDPSGWRDTLVGSTIDFPAGPENKDAELSSTEIAAALAAGLFPLHRHTPSEVGAGSDAPAAVQPLLPMHARDNSTSGRGSSGDDDDLAELGRSSMAGVGTAARSPRIRARHASSAGSMGSLGSLSLGGPHFPSIAPGERLSAYSVAEGVPSSTPPPPPPPPL